MLTIIRIMNIILGEEACFRDRDLASRGSGRAELGSRPLMAELMGRCKGMNGAAKTRISRVFFSAFEL